MGCTESKPHAKDAGAPAKAPAAEPPQRAVPAPAPAAQAPTAEVKDVQQEAASVAVLDELVPAAAAPGTPVNAAAYPLCTYTRVEDRTGFPYSTYAAPADPAPQYPMTVYASPARD
eukprot:TRINITY_DN33093_c0_g1_i1.p2 TRINITY_DN33093_c0_g1~~TRINITY_DN33093_c0_g1_i1.p2  ORF type:complete len:116 (+),score=32.34 TRINITY_DN33093_c0_g1_i1:52-399(+)